jgi:hypothetical protein
VLFNKRSRFLRYLFDSVVNQLIKGYSNFILWNVSVTTEVVAVDDHVLACYFFNNNVNSKQRNSKFRHKMLEEKCCVFLVSSVLGA